MKFLDIFAGIGGFRSGMQLAGHECVGFIENDKFARKSYKAIYDTKGEWSAHDIRTVRSSDLPKAECWCFGFPCQDISVAGQKKGIRQGNRSSLFYAVTKLIKNLKEKDRPQYLFIENVKNLLSINRGFDFLRLLLELDEIGYDAEWDIIDTAEVLPQHRERIYIIGHFRGKSTQQIFPIRPGKKAAFKQPQQVTNTITSRYGNAEGSGTYISQNKSPKIIQRARGKNNGGTKKIAPTLTSHDYEDNNFIYKDLTIRKLTPLECWRLQGFTGEQFFRALNAGLSDSQLYKQAGNAVSVPVIEAIACQL